MRPGAFAPDERAPRCELLVPSNNTAHHRGSSASACTRAPPGSAALPPAHNGPSSALVGARLPSPCSTTTSPRTSDSLLRVAWITMTDSTAYSYQSIIAFVLLLLLLLLLRTILHVFPLVYRLPTCSWQLLQGLHAYTRSLQAAVASRYCAAASLNHGPVLCISSAQPCVQKHTCPETATAYRPKM